MSRKQGGQGPERDLRRRPPNPHHEIKYPHHEKAAEALVCTECGVVHHRGQWYWGAPPVTHVEGALCPACKRIRARDAAGTLELDESFVPHRDEILGMIRNEEEAEKAEHPLERLMGVQDVEGGLVVTTTGIHLARRIANKLERRFHRQARFHYGEGSEALRVDWKSE